MAVVVLNNRYQVIRELGQGGFGRTFLAVDTHLPSERYCVIKQLYPIVSKPKQYRWVRERFQREAAILETLSQGNSQIPQLYAYFAEAETFYLVQEYIEGCTLTEKVEQEGTLSEKEVTQILISLLKVLDYVHRQRIIHRDVKPDNVILRASDNQPVLIDFGIVKEALETVMDSDRAHSIAIGTPGYMPSEQAAGRPTYTSDLYSLGLTAVFLLSGQAPHTLEIDQRTGELLWRKAVPSLGDPLATVIDRAVRFHPRDRFANAKEMLSALTSHSPTVSVGFREEITRRQGTLSNRATVAAVSPSLQTRENGNDWFVGGAIAIGLIISAGAVGYGFVQVLQSLRDRPDTVVIEPTEPPTETPKQEKPTPTPKEETPPEEEPQQEPKLDIEVETPTVVVPTIPLEKESPSEENPVGIPIFSTAATKEQVIDTLGEPTFIAQGSREETESLIYQGYLEGKLELSYLYNPETGNIKQASASFDSSVELALITNTLQEMLQGQATPIVQQALAQVYREETDLRSFAIGDWRGIIQRQEAGTIYIGVWEKDFQ